MELRLLFSWLHWLCSRTRPSEFCIFHAYTSSILLLLPLLLLLLLLSLSLSLSLCLSLPFFSLLILIFFKYVYYRWCGLTWHCQRAPTGHRLSGSNPLLLHCQCAALTGHCLPGSSPLLLLSVCSYLAILLLSVCCSYLATLLVVSSYCWQCVVLTWQPSWL